MNRQHHAGQSANRKYNELARAWRQRFRFFLRGWLVVAVGLGVGGFFVGGQWKLALGIGSGLLLGAVGILSESPPARIQNWRWERGRAEDCEEGEGLAVCRLEGLARSPVGRRDHYR